MRRNICWLSCSVIHDLTVSVVGERVDGAYIWCSRFDAGLAMSFRHRRPSYISGKSVSVSRMFWRFVAYCFPMFTLSRQLLSISLSSTVLTSLSLNIQSSPDSLSSQCTAATVCTTILSFSFLSFRVFCQLDTGGQWLPLSQFRYEL